MIDSEMREQVEHAMADAERLMPSERARLEAIGLKAKKRSPNNFASNPDLASRAGKIGGQNSGGNFKFDPQRAAEVGRKGGKSSRGRKHVDHA